MPSATVSSSSSSAAAAAGNGTASMLPLIAAGLLSLPGLLLSVVTAPIIGLLSLPAAWILLPPASAASSNSSSSSSNNDNDCETSAAHVIVTGGSSGIGLSIAKQAAAANSGVVVQHITLLARTVERLQAAQADIQQAAVAAGNLSVVVSIVSVDISDPRAIQSAADKIMTATKHSTGKTFLFCCAGEAYPEKFEHLTSDTFLKQVQVNQLGTIYTVQAFLPYLKRSKGGTIVLTSSVCGQIGVYGYSAYSPVKFALRGFAEVLHAELLAHNNNNHNSNKVHIQVAYPPDTDTPGYQRENETKPLATAKISELAELYPAEFVAKRMLHAALYEADQRFCVYFDLDGWMVSNLTAGFAPVTNLLDAVTQVSLSSILRWVSLLYVKNFHRIILESEKQEEEEKKKSTKATRPPLQKLDTGSTQDTTGSDEAEKSKSE